MRSRVDFSHSAPVDMDDILQAREQRVQMQRILLEQEGTPLISFTLNIPGPYKTGVLEWRCYQEGLRLIELVLGENRMAVVCREEKMAATGYEALLAVDAPAERVKELMLPLENVHPLGRLLDIDVVDLDGHLLSGAQFGRAERRCILCGGPVWRCARSQAHSYQELSQRAEEIIQDFFDQEFAHRVAVCAQRALITEACAAPKPGLVDRLTPGSRQAPDLLDFVSSGCALGPFFQRVTLEGLRFEGEPEEMLETLRFEGILAEEAMLEATGGVNTHRGAIFSLGVMCVAAGYLHGRELELRPGTLFFACQRIAAGCLEELDIPTGQVTHGLRAYQQYGLTGVRGEAAAGFPHVRHIALPRFQAALDQGLTVEQAGVVALLHLMAEVDDTNIVSRSDLNTLGKLQRRVRQLIERETILPQLLEKAAQLDTELDRLGLSSRGCADLLAVTLLVHFLTQEADGES